MEDSKRHELLIVLPPELANMAIKVFWGQNELQCKIGISEDISWEQSVSSKMDKYVFIWNNDHYTKIAFSDIIFLKADRSYCEIHYGNDEFILISFPLSSTQSILPSADFVRINRSYIVNMKYVQRLVGNTLFIGKLSLTIGRDYRHDVISRFHFLGIRNGTPLRKT